MSFLRTRIGRELPRRPLWRDLLPIVFLALTILFATTRPFRAEAQSSESASQPAPTSAPASTPAPPSTPTPAPATPPGTMGTPEASPPAAPPTSPAPGGESSVPASKPADAPAEAPAGADDTNVEEPQGPRRAAPPKLSEEEAPEYRESADNNLTFPVDI